MRLATFLFYFLCFGAINSLFSQSLERAIAIVDLTVDQSDIVDSRLFSAEHMVKLAGVPYIITADLETADNYSMVIFSSKVISTTLTNQDKDLLQTYVDNGGTLIIPRLEDPDLFPLFGIESVESSNTRYFLEWDKGLDSKLVRWIDEPEEWTVSLGRPTSGSIYKTLGYTRNGAINIASYEDGMSAAVLNTFGHGQALCIGLSWKEVILRNQINRDYEAQRISSNGFEPTSDVFALFLRGLFLEYNKHAVWLHTSPSNSSSTLMVTHDVDSRTGMESLHYFVDSEKERGIEATYNITVRYMDDALMSDFYLNTEETMDYIKDNGQAFGSHSVGHFFDFADEDIFPMGLAGNTRENYLPLNDGSVTSGGTVFGECEVSKKVLESDLELPITFFRSGHLVYPKKLVDVLDELEYDYNSSNSAADVLTHFPYQNVTGRSFSGKVSSVYELPVTISDVFHSDPISSDNYAEKVEVWNEVTNKNINNGAPIVLLIHPNREYKSVMQNDYTDGLPEDVLTMEITKFGDFWKARENYKFSSTINEDETQLTIFLNGAIDKDLSFVVSDGQLLESITFLDQGGNELDFQSQKWGGKDLLFYYEALIVSKSHDLNSPFEVAVNTFPNPASQSITIECTSTIQEDIAVVLFDTSGKKILDLFSLSKRDIGNKMHKNISTTQITPGTYFVSFLAKNGVVAVRKIVIL